MSDYAKEVVHKLMDEQMRLIKELKDETLRRETAEATLEVAAKQLENKRQECEKLKEELFIVKRSLQSSLEIQAGNGVEEKLSQLEDVLQERVDELFVENIELKKTLEFYADNDTHYTANMCINGAYQEVGGALARKTLEELDA